MELMQGIMQRFLNIQIVVLLWIETVEAQEPAVRASQRYARCWNGRLCKHIQPPIEWGCSMHAHLPHQLLSSRTGTTGGRLG